MLSVDTGVNKVLSEKTAAVCKALWDTRAGTSCLCPCEVKWDGLQWGQRPQTAVSKHQDCEHDQPVLGGGGVSSCICCVDVISTGSRRRDQAAALPPSHFIHNNTTATHSTQRRTRWAGSQGSATPPGGGGRWVKGCHWPWTLGLAVWKGFRMRTASSPAWLVSLVSSCEIWLDVWLVRSSSLTLPLTAARHNHWVRFSHSLIYVMEFDERFTIHRKYIAISTCALDVLKNLRQILTSYSAKNGFGQMTVIKYISFKIITFL